MEASRLNSSSSEGATKEEKSVESIIGHKEDSGDQQISHEGELESTKAEMNEVREENTKLKMKLHQIQNDYKSLQIKFNHILQRAEAKKRSNSTTPHEEEEEDTINGEPELVSLCLGRSRPSDQAKKENNLIISSSKIIREDDKLKDGLKLGLECNFEAGYSRLEPVQEIMSDLSPENSLDERKEEEAGEIWPPSKVLKTMRSGDDDLVQQTSVKRARVSVRARCDTPTMNDGCQWRKYGQKISKGNPCPRAYYRCTVATACPVRKQVQRCAEDMSILITTYEGTHNHPLPISATAMASTTSAAASMLLSGSSSSQPGLGSLTTTTPSTNFLGSTVDLYNNSTTKPFYLPNASTPTFPTITLDLTTGPSSTSSSHFNIFSSSSFQSTTMFPSTSSESNMFPTVWNNGIGNLNYGTTTSYNKTNLGSFNIGRLSGQEHFYQAYQKNNHQAPSQHDLTETLTKVITSDPNFRSVIAAAFSSVVSGDGERQRNKSGGESFGLDLKWGEAIQANASNALTSNGIDCASKFLTRTSSSSSQAGSLMLVQQQPPLPFSVLKSTCATTAEKKEQAN